MHTAPALSTSHPRPGDAAQRVRNARPDLSTDAPAFRAAVVLLAGPELRFNIDRIATRCALPRPWVAACVRRLVDNGVWVVGRAEYPWRGPDDPRFWNDAAVAEGRLLRRARDGGGVEWAPAGAWEKAYDFVGPQSDPGGALLYFDAAPECAGPEGSAPEADAPGIGTVDQAGSASPAVPGAAARPSAGSTPDPTRAGGVAVEHAPVPVSFPALAGAGDGWLGMPASDDRMLAGVGAGSGAPELFPGADWLH